MTNVVDPLKEPGRKIRLALLRNEVDDDHTNWLLACQERADRVDLEVVDITHHDWLDRVRDGRFDGLLTQPTGWSTRFKNLYDERTEILDEIFRIPMYPSRWEIRIYENKKYLSYWLKANRIPHPATYVFHFRDEALEFVRTADHPLVGKTNIGAGGSGVRILRTATEAERYIREVFSSRGATRSIGPKWRGSGFVGRVIRKLNDPAALRDRMKKYRILRGDVQRDMAILQQYVPHDFEWRAVRIGDSFFAHKKLVKGDRASGSLLKEYGAPPVPLLDLVRSITDEHRFYSQAIDLFEAPGGRFLVNEMQCIFGQSDPHQMIVDGVPGRYRYIADQWVFEAGEFNRFESYLLRLDHFLSVLNERVA